MPSWLLGVGGFGVNFDVLLENQKFLLTVVQLIVFTVEISNVLLQSELREVYCDDWQQDTEKGLVPEGLEACMAFIRASILAEF
jgi:hypothetical protein